MHKTTLNLDSALFLRLRNRAEVEGTTISDLVNRLLSDALARGPEGMPFSSHAVGVADVDDLGTQAEKYLADTIT
ncbi:MAG: hypothetical protein ACR2JP_06545 [Acidimicrobiia bacterium]